MSGDVYGVDPSRSYSDAEQQALTLNLESLVKQVGELARHPLTVDLLLAIHRTLFREVRTHSGRHRGADYGSPYLVFGPNRSTPREAVPRELSLLFRKIRDQDEALLANLDDPDFVEHALRFAVWAHAEVVRIHPFEDGNGRTSRMLMSVLLVRHGLFPIPIEACKSEYCACLNDYFTRRARHDESLGALFDLFLRLAAPNEP